MCNFSLDGITTKLIPLDLNGIGFINCYPFPQKQDTTDSLAIGIIIPEGMYRSKGYGTEALKIYSEYLFKCGTSFIFLITTCSNYPMLSAAKKNGFSLCGDFENQMTQTILKKQRKMRIGYDNTEKSDTFNF